MRNRRIKKEVNGGTQDWLLTYSDMVTLLLCFFVLLYTFSVVDQEKFLEIISGLRAKLGVLDGGRTLSRSELIDGGKRYEMIGEMELSQMEFENLFLQVTEYIEEAGLQNQVEAIYTHEGLVIRFVGRLLFDLGKTELRADSVNLLNQIAEFLKDIKNDITVEGHTDDWPINTKEFPTNWELSTARATTVVRYFTEELGMAAARFSASGSGEYRPIRPNDTEENRAQNRRVDLVVRRSYIAELEFGEEW